MNKKKFLILIVLGVFCIGMSMGAVSAVKTVEFGKHGQYKIILSNKNIKKIKEGKLVTKWTKKYVKYRIGKKIHKYKVYISVKKDDTGHTKKGKYSAALWSHAGLMDSKWVKL